jgi:hypothetical protein
MEMMKRFRFIVTAAIALLCLVGVSCVCDAAPSPTLLILRAGINSRNNWEYEDFSFYEGDQGSPWVNGSFTPNSVNFSHFTEYTSNYPGRRDEVSFWSASIILDMYILGIPGTEYKGHYSVSGGLSCEMLNIQGLSGAGGGTINMNIVGEKIPLPSVICDADSGTGLPTADSFRFESTGVFTGTAGGGAVSLT